MNSFELLPFEVLEDRFAKLQPEEIMALSKTCRRFHDVSQSDKIWREVCLYKFGIRFPVSDNGFARRLYKNVLHRYGRIIGHWTKDVNKSKQDFFGGLLQVTYSDGQLHGIELQVPKIPHLMENLRPKTIFTISMDEAKDDKVVISCTSHHHECILQHDEKKLKKSSSSWHLMRQCSAAPFGGIGQREKQKLLQQFGADHSTIALDEPNRVYQELKFKSFLGENESHYSRLKFPSACQFNVPIQPGIFKGTEGSKGIKLLMLSYKDANIVTGLNITGDLRGHAGEMSFQADLRYCMYLMDQESQSKERLEEMEPVFSDIGWSELPTPQPFWIPERWQPPSDYVPKAPDQCLARFHGSMPSKQGVSPEWKDHWVVFNEDVFGFLSLNLDRRFLYNWTLFHRVQDPALQVTSQL